MIAVIVFALIVLACSYLKVSPDSNSEENNSSRQISYLSAGSAEKDETLANNMSPCSDDKQVKVVVIMAGDDTPTFIANPTSTSAK